MRAAAVCVAIPEPSTAFRVSLIDEMYRQSTSAMMNGTSENQCLDCSCFQPSLPMIVVCALVQRSPHEQGGMDVTHKVQ